MRRGAARLPRHGEAARRGLQPGLRLLLLPPQGGALPRQRLPHDRRAARDVRPPAHRGASRARGDLHLAGRRADADGARLLPAGRRAAARSTASRACGSTTRSRPTARCWTTSGAGSSAENDFLVGVSLDGPRHVPRRLPRATRAARRTFDRVMAGVALLQKHRVEFNILACVHAANAGRGLEVYRFLRDEVGAPMIQFIPVVEPTSQDSGRATR